MSESTPGPWIIFSSPGLHKICPAMRPGVIASIVNDGQHDADASLIRAAPAMLKALQIAEVLLIGTPENALFTDGKRAIRSVIELATTPIAVGDRRAALSKAEPTT